MFFYILDLVRDRKRKQERKERSKYERKIIDRSDDNDKDMHR